MRTRGQVRDPETSCAPGDQREKRKRGEGHGARVGKDLIRDKT